MPALRRSNYGLLAKGYKLSMDGRVGWPENLFVERLWRSVKYERFYFKAYDSVSAARVDIADFMDWFNTQRPPPLWTTQHCL